MRWFTFSSSIRFTEPCMRKRGSTHRRQGIFFIVFYCCTVHFLVTSEFFYQLMHYLLDT
jgi:hypothetical protein